MASYNERCGCDGGLPSEFYQIERTITDINNHPPTPGTNGYWMIWNPAKRAYEESTVPLPEGTLPDISDATKGWYLTNDGERVYWAKVNGGGGGEGDITAIQVNGIDQPIVDKVAQLTISKTTVGLSNVENVRQYSSINPPPYPVTSVDGSTGDVATLSVKYTKQTLTAEQQQQARENIGAGTSNFDGAYASLTGKPNIPSKTSELENDSGFITDAALAGYAKAEDIPTAVSELENDAGYITAAQAPVQSVNGQTGAVTISVPTKTSDLTNDSGYITVSDVPVESVNGQTGVVQLTASDVGAISTSNISQTIGTSTTKVPSEKAVSDALAAGGHGDMLKSVYDADNAVADAGGIAEYVSANGGKIDTIKVNGTAQTITDKAVDITVPTATSALTNDSGYITADALQGYAKEDAIPTTVSQLENDVGYITAGEVPVQSVNGQTGAVTITKGSIGLGEVDNTSDADKPVSTAQANAIAQVQENLDQLSSNLSDGTVVVAKATGDANGNNIANTYATKAELADITAVQIRNKDEVINATQATVQTVATQYMVDNYGRQPQNWDGLILTITDMGNDKILYIYSEVSSLWINAGINNVDLSQYVGVFSQQFTDEQKAQARANIGAGVPYTLPMADATTLGGVKPVAKTNDMTGSVGVDENGQLWVKPGADISTIPADKVMFDSDLVFTYQFGKYTPTGGKVTVPAGNKSLLDVLNDAYSEDKNPTITQPSIGISSSTARAYEVGTSVTPAYSGSFNAGSYQYGPSPTGAAITEWLASNNVTTETKTTQTGTFAAYVVPDGSNYRITIKGTYGDGVIPVTALGKQYPAGQIKGTTKTAQSGAITGYRNSFYGTLEDKTTAINSATIRGLAQKSGKALANGNTFTVNIPVGAQVVLVAYPATLRDVTSIKDVNGLNADITSAFTKSAVNVDGAAGYTAISYKVYRLDFAKPNDAANKYTVTI